MQVSARSLDQLKAVFGDCLPKQNAAAMLEQSPAAPTSPAELQELRAILVVAAAGEKLAELAAHLEPTPTMTTSTQPRPLPSAAALQLRQIHAARELRIFTEKIFTIPTSGDLVMETAKAKLGFTVAIYHEAVVVHVQTETGLERRVIDPSVGDKPLTVAQWLSTMHPSPVTPMGDVVPESERGSLETFFLPRFAYGLSDRSAPPTAWDPKDLASAFKWNDDAKLVQKDYEDGGFYDELPKLAGKLPAGRD